MQALLTRKTKLADPNSCDQQALIYMDHNGSTPTHPEAIKAMMPFINGAYGNPSSGHWAADPAKEAVESARESVARFIGAMKSEIVFTSGATEANNMAIKGVIRKNEKTHIITSAIEHDAVLKPLRAMRSQDVKITVLPVNSDGIVDPQAVRKAICEDTKLITIMTANNEVGTIQPIAEIGAIARKHGVLFHTDAAQAAGKVAIDVNEMGVDMLSLAGHKFGAPNGIGAIFIRKGLKISPLIHGAGHEMGRRAGTESALLTAGIGAAAKQAVAKETQIIQSKRDYFWNCLIDRFGNRVHLNGHRYRRVPNTLSISFPGHVGAEILAKMPHVAATTGSACHAGCVSMSHVLIAMGKSVEIGMGTIRFSLGDETTLDEIDRVVDGLKKIVK